jgi:hypothetical protein
VVEHPLGKGFDAKLFQKMQRLTALAKSEKIQAIQKSRICICDHTVTDPYTSGMWGVPCHQCLDELVLKNIELIFSVKS